MHLVHPRRCLRSRPIPPDQRSGLARLGTPAPSSSTPGVPSANTRRENRQAGSEPGCRGGHSAADPTRPRLVPPEPGDAPTQAELQYRGLCGQRGSRPRLAGQQIAGWPFWDYACRPRSVEHPRVPTVVVSGEQIQGTVTASLCDGPDLVGDTGPGDQSDARRRRIGVQMDKSTRVDRPFEVARPEQFVDDQGIPSEIPGVAPVANESCLGGGTAGGRISQQLAGRAANSGRGRAVRSSVRGAAQVPCSRGSQRPDCPGTDPAPWAPLRPLTFQGHARVSG